MGVSYSPRSSIPFASGAKSFGFRVFWISRGGAPVDRLGFTPDEILKTLGDLKL